ncbi:MAG: GAF domain-containing protein, partial [Anaerolineae bacterium]|nr:GAF domain-containing protein [Anaerolineae bacterium]
MNDVCKTVVEKGGYDFAWVGLMMGDGNEALTPVARAGHKQGYLEVIRQVNPVCDPTFSVLKTRQIQVNHTIRPENCPIAAAYQWAAVLSAPLIANEQVMGVLSVYAVDANALQDEEVALLGELAEDLAFGITTRRMQVDHQRMAL